MKWLVGLLIVFFYYGPSNAEPVLTAMCNEPVGVRYDLIDGKILKRDDGYSGVNPVFIIGDDNPDKMIFIWGPANAAKSIGYETKALEAVIVSTTKDKITAIRLDDPAYGVVHMYSLYPSKGLVYFTQHRSLALSGVIPNSSTYYARCKFTRN